tara:strand:- start:62 stop:223 length:162 start_codon:yes stop_codon:yes gene_type:complete
MNPAIKKIILNNLDNIYSIILDNNEESKEINKILTLIDQLQYEIDDLEQINNK